MRKTICKITALISVFAVILSLFSVGLLTPNAAEGAKAKVYEFDSAADLNDFNAYYWSRSGGYAKEPSVTTSFTLSGGALNRTKSSFHNGEGKAEDVLALTLNDPTIRNFDATFEIMQDRDNGYSKQIGVGFREKTPGQATNGYEWTWGTQLDGTKIPVIFSMSTDRKISGTYVSAEASGLNYVSGYNTLRLKVVENKVNIWLNGTKVVTDGEIDASTNQCGYLSLYFAATKGGVRKISVTRLDKNGNEIDFVPNIAFSASPVALAVGTSLQDVVSALPTQVNAVYDGYEVPVTVSGWASADYNPNAAGSYTFKAPVGGFASYFSNLSVKVNVKLSEDIVENGLKDATAITDMFATYYSDNANQEAFKTSALNTHWTVDSTNGITRIASVNANAASDGQNMAMLVYKKKKLSNFVLTVNYKQGTDSTAKAPIVGFGANTMGTFACNAGGGYAAYVTSDGKLKLWSDKFSTSNDYRKDDAAVPNYNRNAEHTMKIVVGSTKAVYFVDGVQITTVDLTGYTDGYVYLALGSNRGTFKNFSISPLIGVHSIAGVADVSVPLMSTIDKAIAKLPASIETTLDDGSKKTYPIKEWTSANYDENYSGRYTFIGKLDATSSENPALLTAKATVEVTESYDPDITKRYYFTDENELKDFKAYFASEANPNNKGYGFKEVDWRNNWSLVDGMIKRNYQGGSDDFKNIALLELDTKKYKNFSLTVDYKQGEETYRWAMVGFGAKNKGEFAISDGGGRAVYAQQEGNLFGWGKEYVTGWEYHMGYQEDAPENFERNAIHRLRLTVIGNYMTLQLDNYEPVVAPVAENYTGGYIYLAVNGNSAMYDNLTIVDLDVKERTITSIPKSKQIVYDHNDKFAEYELPTTVDVICDDGKAYPMEVEWSCPSFRSNLPGVYNHTGKIILPSGVKFKNPKNLKGSIDLQVIVDYNPATSIKYYFDTELELKDFDTYYTPTTGNDGLMKVPTNEQWLINEEGRLARINQEFKQLAWSEEFASTKLSTFVWNRKTLENFEIEVDYKQGSNTWLWAMVVFGIKDPTKWITEYTGTDSVNYLNNGVAAYAQQEGTATVWGNVGVGGHRTAVDLPGVVGYNRNAVNHMKIRVLNGKMQMWINEATDPLTVNVASNDTKGKIALACGMNLAEYDNLLITALDAKGNATGIGLPTSGGTAGGSNNYNGSSPQTGDVTPYDVLMRISIIVGIAGLLAGVLYVAVNKKSINAKH